MLEELIKKYEDKMWKYCEIRESYQEILQDLKELKDKVKYQIDYEITEICEAIRLEREIIGTNKE